MLEKIENEKEISFLRIGEMYPDSYILVRITEIDHTKGRERGVAIYTSESRSELAKISNKENLIENTIILQGVNLMPVFGGLL
ncbi:MAG: hypothetical protein FWH05_07985 [Oscillospiraceae bacterium]|nr:hypothetical protein [Oscillospiraceae bacterium]